MYTEKQREQKRKYQRKHQTHISKYKKQYYQKNRRRIRSKQLEQRLKRRYGLNIEGFKILEETQRGLCAICGQPPAKQPLCVDHDHFTGRVRGLLCRPCNSFLGRVKDQPQRAVEYLKRGLD